MTKIRKAAEGEPCLLRLPICNRDPATTVLAHVRGSGNAGVGMKPPDVSGIFACSNCHDALDGRADFTPYPQDILDGMLRTHDRLRQMGLIR